MLLIVGGNDGIPLNRGFEICQSVGSFEGFRERVPKADSTRIEGMTVTIHPRAWDEEVEFATGSCEGFQVQLWGLNEIMDGFIEHGDLELGSSFLKGGPT